MTPINHVLIDAHTTSSSPHLHILYVLDILRADGTRHKTHRRYSEFIALKAELGDPYVLPDKHSLATTIAPRFWVQDALISERKEGLATYINLLLKSLEFQCNPLFIQFLSPGPFGPLLESRPEMKTVIPTIIASGNGVTPSLIAASYYPAWSTDALPLHKIDFSKFDIIFFCGHFSSFCLGSVEEKRRKGFVTPTGTADINWDDGAQEKLRQLVLNAKKSGKGTHIVLSLGGWSGSHWFSQATSNAANRSRLVRALVGAVNKFDLDGIDIDWEYPNSLGAGNPHSPEDAGNFLIFLKLLRSALGHNRIISAAVTHLPWLGVDGKPLSDVSPYAAQLTYINIMNYDVFGATSPPGPNAPLSNRCNTNSQSCATAEAAFEQWTKAGMPASKLLLGLPLYGYVCKSTAKRLSGSSAPFLHNFKLCPETRLTPMTMTTEFPTTSIPTQGDLSSMWGRQIAFNQILSSGALRKTSDGKYEGVNGFTMAWDDCSNTPFLYNVDRSTVVPFDDTWSLAAKAKFAKQSGMAGCFTWSMDQDDGLTLQNTIRRSLNKK